MLHLRCNIPEGMLSMVLCLVTIHLGNVCQQAGKQAAAKDRAGQAVPALGAETAFDPSELLIPAFLRQG